MQVILQGSLRHFAPAELLRFLGSNRRGGTLDFQAEDGSRARLFLRDGSVIYAEASEAADLVAVVAQALGIEAGSFALLDEVVLPDGVAPQPAEIGPLLEAAAKRAAEAKSFPDNARFRVQESADQSQISMSGDELRLVLRIGQAGRSFGELMAERKGSREDLARILRTMQERGLIARDSEDAAAAAPAAPAPPPVTRPQANEQPVTQSQPMEQQPVSRRRGAALTGGDGDAHVLIGDSYTIGRDAASNDIAVIDSSISTHHARISRDGDSFVIVDLGSRNGTFVNGDQVDAAPKPLADNDEVRLGRVVFTFNIASEVKPGDTTERKVTRRGGTRQ